LILPRSRMGHTRTHCLLLAPSQSLIHRLGAILPATHIQSCAESERKPHTPSFFTMFSSRTSPGLTMDAPGACAGYTTRTAGRNIPYPYWLCARQDR
jgi:hypothetical protein